MSDDTTRLPTTGVRTHVPVRSAEGVLWECPVDYLPIALEKGFVEVDEEEVDVVDEIEITGFDPTEHSVKAVNDYLATVTESPGEIDRVLAIEAANQGRTTIVDPRPPVA